ncbi:hypothetical protein AURDEDRAFT_178012 [Auricularia subglabra TFB-10046 SS5]|uniref:Ubiquitin-like protease family profile domain-containing protein n=1 Tax=Auricularia subglabra (strain TFB-10046 / SS5) TaxID=717982 RepID=J0D2N5_AURST|nr:hypothetical protein AURDEDRAFT_178012 [Auricularia subglabra TFB-10046 SS5]
MELRARSKRSKLFLELCDEFYQENIGGAGFRWVGEMRGKRQTNTYDCGPFVAADVVSLMQSNAPSPKSQSEMGAWRRTMEERVRALRLDGGSRSVSADGPDGIPVDSDDD